MICFCLRGWFCLCASELVGCYSVAFRVVLWFSFVVSGLSFVGFLCCGFSWMFGFVILLLMVCDWLEVSCVLYGLGILCILVMGVVIALCRFACVL